MLMSIRKAAKPRVKDMNPAQDSRTAAARVRRPDVHRSYVIPVLSKTITIIQLLERTKRSLNVDEISRETGVAKSTTYRILRTLSAYGYLPEGANGVYRVDFKPRVE